MDNMTPPDFDRAYDAFVAPKKLYYHDRAIHICATMVAMVQEYLLVNSGGFSCKLSEFKQSVYSRFYAEADINSFCPFKYFDVAFNMAVDKAIVKLNGTGFVANLIANEFSVRMPTEEEWDKQHKTISGTFPHEPLHKKR